MKGIKQMAIYSSLKRIGLHYYILGLSILSLGIAFAIQSMLGASPLDALTVGLYGTFGLTIGSWNFIMGLVIITINALAEKKRLELFALVTSFFTGVGIDSWLVLLRSVANPDTLVHQWIFLIISLVLAGLGIAIYLQSEVAPNPLDRTMIIVSKFTKGNVTYSRFLISIVFVIVAYFFDGAIGIGTLINAIFLGYFINLYITYISKLKVAKHPK